MSAPTTWQYTDSSKLIVMRVLPNGDQESAFATRIDVAEWIEAGNTPSPPPSAAPASKP